MARGNRDIITSILGDIKKASKEGRKEYFLYGKRVTIEVLDELIQWGYTIEKHKSNNKVGYIIKWS